MKLLFEVIKLLEQKGGKLSDIKQDKSGSNIYVFTINNSEIVVHSRCLKAFYEALKALKN